MKTKILLLLFIAPLSLVYAQSALFNNGSMRIHEGGSIGFHTNFINNTPFDGNLGFAGFYSDDFLSISGTAAPQFFDVELMIQNSLRLGVGMSATNTTSFILGDIRTSKNDSQIQYIFADANSSYLGSGNLRKIDGYAAVTNTANFMFPVGDALLLRPLSINGESATQFAKCAYFFDDTTTITDTLEDFDFAIFTDDLAAVNDKEFWTLESSTLTAVTVSWTERSDIATLTDDTAMLVLAGWHTAERRWQNLGVSSLTGDLNEGIITSNLFIPDNYAALTIATSRDLNAPFAVRALKLENYYISPNGDGVNDFLVIPKLNESPNNMLRIFDRFGIEVFKKENYTDEFSGIPNTSIVLGKEQNLPTGVYFYTIYAADLDLNYQGFLYLAY